MDWWRHQRQPTCAWLNAEQCGMPNERCSSLALMMIAFKLSPIIDRRSLSPPDQKSKHFVFSSCAEDRIDEFRMVLGGQPKPCSFFSYNRIHKKQIFTLPVVNDNEFVRNTSGVVEENLFGVRSCCCRRVPQVLVTLDNAYGWKQMALAGHPRPCETRLYDSKMFEKVIPSRECE